MTEQIYESLHRLARQISRRRRLQLLVLFFLTSVASLFEIMSIGAVIPFLGALVDPERLLNNSHLSYFRDLAGISNSEQLLVFLTIIFISLALLAGVMRMTLVWISTRLAHVIGADLSFHAYERTLCQPYAVHLNSNSSEVIAAIVSKVNVVINGIIMPLITLASASLLLVTISGALVFVSLSVTLFSVAGFAAIYLGIIRLTRRIKQRNGEEIADKSTRVVKTLQEGLGGVRDILLGDNHEAYCTAYRKADIPLRKAQASSQFIMVSPRFAIESIGMCVIALIALFLTRWETGIESSIPTLGALAIGAQRLLPVMQQSYAAWSSLVTNAPVLKDVLHYLEQPQKKPLVLKDDSEIKFCSHIQLRTVSFRYSAQRSEIFSEIDVRIEKGDRIGIIGTTGCGKTTLVDLLMGLLIPDRGYLEIDGVRVGETNRRGWQRRITHVPQDVFLTDNSVAENIAFGIDKFEIDMERVKNAASQAHIATDITNWDLGYETVVGERGVRLSGGQRQRIGIARAFYKNADVIIFDEATSALDEKTESAVIEEIEKLDKKFTLIMIAHRKSTLKRCTKIIEIAEEGQILMRIPGDISENKSI